METGIDIEELVHYRNIIIIYILNNAANKIPIKQSDLLDITDKKTRTFKYSFELAQESLQKIYGILLKEVPNNKSGKKFICCSEDSSKSINEWDDEQRRQMTLLFLILSFIFMKTSPVYESELESFLNGLKIYFESEHEYFGSHLKKLITETFVKQLYLQKEKSISEFDTESKYLYAWGFRSTIEFSKKNILEATAKILEVLPNHFIAQYNDAMQDDCNDDD